MGATLRAEECMGYGDVSDDGARGGRYELVMIWSDDGMEC